MTQRNDDPDEMAGAPSGAHVDDAKRAATQTPSAAADEHAAEPSPSRTALSAAAGCARCGAGLKSLVFVQYTRIEYPVLRRDTDPTGQLVVTSEPSIDYGSTTDEFVQCTRCSARLDDVHARFE